MSPCELQLIPGQVLVLYIITQLLALSFLMVGGRSRISERWGCWDTRLRPRRELERFSCGLGSWATDATVVTWKTSRTLFSEYLDVHSAYATAPICLAKDVPYRREKEITGFNVFYEPPTETFNSFLAVLICLYKTGKEFIISPYKWGQVSLSILYSVFQATPPYPNGMAYFMVTTILPQLRHMHATRERQKANEWEERERERERGR